MGKQDPRHKLLTPRASQVVMVTSGLHECMVDNGTEQPAFLVNVINIMAQVSMSDELVCDNAPMPTEQSECEGLGDAHKSVSGGWCGML